MKTTNLNDRAFDSVLDVYEQLGSKIPPLCEYLQLFTTLPESEGCLVYVYRDVLTFHRLAYKLFSLQSSCEIKPRILIVLMTSANPSSSVAETVQAHLESTERYVRAPGSLTGKTFAVHTSAWIVPPNFSTELGPN